MVLIVIAIVVEKKQKRFCKLSNDFHWNKNLEITCVFEHTLFLFICHLFLQKDPPKNRRRHSFFAVSIQLRVLEWENIFLRHSDSLTYVPLYLFSFASKTLKTILWLSSCFPCLPESSAAAAAAAALKRERIEAKRGSSSFLFDRAAIVDR